MLLVTTALILLTLLLCCALIAARAVRGAQERHRGRHAARVRPSLIALMAGDREESRAAADQLAGLDARSWAATVPLLSSMLGQVKGESAQAAISVLHARSEVARALRRLRSGSVARRIDALELLAATGTRQAVPSAIALLEHRDPALRRAAARALGRLGSDEATEALLRTLGRPGSIPLPIIVRAVSQIGEPAHEQLRHMLDGTTQQRAGTAEICGLVQAIGTVGQLQRLVRHDFDTDVRIRAARAIGRIGLPRAVPDLIEAAGPNEPAGLRAVSARALGEIGDESAVPALAGLTRDRHPQVRDNAARALLGCGPGGQAALLELARQPDDLCCREVVALAVLRHQLAAPAWMQVA